MSCDKPGSLGDIAACVKCRDESMQALNGMYEQTADLASQSDAAGIVKNRQIETDKYLALADRCNAMATKAKDTGQLENVKKINQAAPCYGALIAGDLGIAAGDLKGTWNAGAGKIKFVLTKGNKIHRGEFLWRRSILEDKMPDTTALRNNDTFKSLKM